MFFASRLKPGNSALGSTHALRNGILSEACPRTSLEHLVGKLILKFQGFIRFSETLALGGASQESLVVVCHGLVTEVSHVATP